MTILNKLNIFCGFVESTKPVSCVEIDRNNLTKEKIILISYEANLVEERYIALTYSNQLCEVYEELNIAGINTVTLVERCINLSFNFF